MQFEQQEYEMRVARLQAALAERSLDAMLVDEPEALIYYANKAPSRSLYRALVVPREGPPAMVLRRLDAPPFHAASWVEDVRGFRDWEGPHAALADLIRERGLDGGRLGYDGTSTCFDTTDGAALREALPEAELVPLPLLLWELRLIKSQAEIALLRRAANMADEAMRHTMATATEGMNGRHLRASVQAVFAELGADFARVGQIAIGRGWDFLHAEVGDARLTAGDILHLELVPRIGGYVSKVMRSVSVGPATTEQRRVAALLCEAQDRQIAAMRPGALGCDVDALVRDAVLEAELRTEYDNITGYTLGLNVDANPRTSEFTRIFHPEAHFPLEVGMVFHVYTSAAGIAFSETVLVDEHGPERLTRLERVLFEI